MKNDALKAYVKIDTELTAEELAEKFVTSADNLFSANSNDNFVLVEFSKKKINNIFTFKNRHLLHRSI